MKLKQHIIHRFESIVKIYKEFCSYSNISFNLIISKIFKLLFIHGKLNENVEENSYMIFKILKDC